MRHVYNFSNMGGRKCQVVTSKELSEELLAKYKKVLGIACTHTEEPMGNEIARPVVVEPSREYDAAGAHIEALRAELDQMTARCAELERWADQVLNAEYATGDEKKKAADVLRPDAVSLSAIKADTLEKTVCDNALEEYRTDFDLGWQSALQKIYDEAAALREGGE